MAGKSACLQSKHHLFSRAT